MGQAFQPGQSRGFLRLAAAIILFSGALMGFSSGSLMAFEAMAAAPWEPPPAATSGRPGAPGVPGDAGRPTPGGPLALSSKGGTAIADCSCEPGTKPKTVRKRLANPGANGPVTCSVKG